MFMKLKYRMFMKLRYITEYLIDITEAYPTLEQKKRQEKYQNVLGITAFIIALIIIVYISK